MEIFNYNALTFNYIEVLTLRGNNSKDMEIVI